MIMIVATSNILQDIQIIGGGRGGAGGRLPPHLRKWGGGGATLPHFFADGIFFYMRTPANADMQPI